MVEDGDILDGCVLTPVEYEMLAIEGVLHVLI